MYTVERWVLVGCLICCVLCYVWLCAVFHVVWCGVFSVVCELWLMSDMR
jgi:hypothetical protein